MVEPPGIAPGSGPLITSAFIAISGASPGKTYIGAVAAASKRRSGSTASGSACRLARAVADRTGFPVRQRAHALALGAEGGVVVLARRRIGGVIRRQTAIIDVVLVHTGHNGPADGQFTRMAPLGPCLTSVALILAEAVTVIAGVGAQLGPLFARMADALAAARAFDRLTSADQLLGGGSRSCGRRCRSRGRSGRRRGGRSRRNLRHGGQGEGDGGGDDHEQPDVVMRDTHTLFRPCDLFTARRTVLATIYQRRPPSCQ